MERKLLLLVFFTAICATASAQFKKGGFIAGGSMSFAYSKVSQYYDPASPPTKSTETTFAFRPQVGYFVIDNLAVGIVGDVTTDKTKDSADEGFVKINSFTAGPFVRYYYQKFFASASYGIGSYHYDALSDGEYKFTNKISSATFGLGYAFLLNEFVAIEPAVTYVLNNSKQKDDSSAHETSGQFMLSVGIQFYIHK